MAKLIQENLYGMLNELMAWRLERLNTDPGHTEARFYYNEPNERLMVGCNTVYKEVAYMADLLGLNNWKSNILVATTTNITLSGTQTVDGVALVAGDRVLVKNQTDLTENGYYEVATGAWTRITEADTGTEITNSMCIVEQGATHGGQIWKNTDNDPLTLGTDDVHFAQVNLNVPVEDKFVKISATDTVEKYLRASVNNGTAAGDALNNLTNIQVQILNGGGNEMLEFALDMSTYVGNIEVQGDLHITGTTTLNDLDFDAGSTVNRDNTTQTGTTTYDSSYNANYDGSTIVYNDADIDYTGTTTVDYASTVVTNHNGDTINNTNTTENNVGVTNNYDSTSTTNQNGTTNYSTTSVENHDGDTINNNNNTINNTSTFTALGCSGAGATPVDESINASATKVDVDIVYDNTTNVAGDTRSKTVTVTEQSGLVTVNDVANGHSGELTVEWNTGTGNIEVRQTSGAGTSTADVCQFSGGVIINDNGSITNNENTIVNNDNTTNNNTNVNEYYDEDSSVTNMGNTYNENLIANNIVIENGGSIVVNGSWIKQSENTVGATEIVLSDTPMSGEAGLMVFKQDSGIHRTEPDYTYDAVNNKITFTALVAGEVVEIRYMRAGGMQVQTVYPVEISGNTHTAAFGEYIVITNATSDTTITLPNATVQNGGVIKIKKFTGEDVYVTSIDPVGGQLIDGYTGAQMNVDRTMYTFTSINGNRYLGD